MLSIKNSLSIAPFSTSLYLCCSVPISSLVLSKCIFNPVSGAVLSIVTLPGWPFCYVEEIFVLLNKRCKDVHCIERFTSLSEEEQIQIKKCSCLMLDVFMLQVRWVSGPHAWLMLLSVVQEVCEATEE